MPYANALIQGPTLRPPKTKPSTLVVVRRQYKPTPTATPTKIKTMQIFATMIVPLPIDIV